MYIQSQNETESNLHSCLMDLGASKSVLKIPTYMVINPMLNMIHPKRWLLQINLNFSIKHLTSVNCFSSIKTKSKCFKIPSAVVDIEKDILGTPFFDKNLQNIQNFTMIFRHSFSDQTIIASSSTLIEKNPIFPSIHQIEPK